MLKTWRESKGLTQSQLADKFGLKYQAIQKWENGTSKPKTKQLPALSKELDIPIMQLVAALQGEIATEGSSAALEKGVVYQPHKQFGTPATDIQYVDLPYVSVAARASFTEMGEVEEGTYRAGESYRVPYTPGQNFKDHWIFEVNGDSMEPYYWAGMKVRASQMNRERWPYLNSGVYVIVYADFFVIKRIKSNNYSEGFFWLHSDNETTGGSMRVPIDRIRSMWRVEWIEGGPAR